MIYLGGRPFIQHSDNSFFWQSILVTTNDHLSSLWSHKRRASKTLSTDLRHSNTSINWRNEKYLFTSPRLKNISLDMVQSPIHNVLTIHWLISQTFEPCNNVTDSLEHLIAPTAHAGEEKAGDSITVHGGRGGVHWGVLIICRGLTHQVIHKTLL